MPDRGAVVTVVFLVVFGTLLLIAWGAQALLLFALFAVVAIAMVIFVPTAGGWWEDASRGRFKYRDRS
jgi:hypothetical protein